MLEWLTPEFGGYLKPRHLCDLVLSYLLAIPSAWDREVRDRAIGLRTFPLVAVAAHRFESTILISIATFLTLGDLEPLMEASDAAGE